MHKPATIQEAVGTIVAQFLNNYYAIFGNIQSRTYPLIITLVPGAISTQNFIGGLEFNGWHQGSLTKLILDEAYMMETDFVNKYREIRCNVFYDHHACKININDLKLIPRHDQENRSSHSSTDGAGEDEPRCNTGSWHSDAGN